MLRKAASSARVSRERVDFAHLAWLLAVAGFLLWYLVDASGSSARLENLILIVPAVGLALILVAAIAIDEFRGVAPRAIEGTAKPPSEGSSLEDRLVRHREAILIAVFGLYVAAIPVLRFEVANVGLLFGTLVLNGERRPGVLVGFSLVFGIGIALLFKAALPIRLPTIL